MRTLSIPGRGPVEFIRLQGPTMLLSSGDFRFASWRIDDASSRARSSALSYVGFALGTLALLALAACGGGSSCGGGGGYTSDNLPQPGMLDSCSSSGGVMNSTPTNSTDMVLDAMIIDVNGSRIANGTYTIFSSSFSPFAQSGGYITLNSLTANPPHLTGQTVAYAFTTSGSGSFSYMYCSLVNATDWWWNYPPYAFTAVTAGAGFTLNAQYPTTAVTPLNLACQATDGGGHWTNLFTFTGVP